MELPLDSAVFRSVEKIPIAAGTSVIAPMRDGRRVTQNRIERDLGLLLVAKIFRPCINLFLAGRVPRHFAAEGVFFILPALGALSHAGSRASACVFIPSRCRSRRIWRNM